MSVELLPYGGDECGDDIVERLRADAAAEFLPLLNAAADEIEYLRRIYDDLSREARYDSADMGDAWEAGARWVAERVEIVDGELFVPEDMPGVEGWDYAEAFGSWIEGYDSQTGEP